MKAPMILALSTLCLGALLLLAQVPPAPAPGIPGPASAPPAAGGPAGLESADKDILVEGESLYRHMADRDPFSPLITLMKGKGGDVKFNPQPTGIGRFAVESCNLEGIVKTPRGIEAWFQDPEGKPVKVSVGTQFADGRVTGINYEKGQVIVQQELINDPTHVKPFRDLVLSVRNVGGEIK